MKLRCPACDARLTVPDELRGHRGRCPTCDASFPIVPADEGPAPGVAVAAEPVASVVGRPVSPGTDLDDIPMVEPIEDEDDGYGMAPDDDPPRPVAPPRPGFEAEPRRKKSRREQREELDELRDQGNRFLLQIRVLLLALGLLTVVFNGYVFTTIDASIEEFRGAAQAANVDPAKVDEVVAKLRPALYIETGMYFVMGLALCVLAIVIGLAPKIATIAALASYFGAWVLDLLLIQVIFGDIAMGQSLFSIATIVKVGIISGLWYGVRVGLEYEEQVARPLRKFRRYEDVEAEAG